MSLGEAQLDDVAVTPGLPCHSPCELSCLQRTTILARVGDEADPSLEQGETLPQRRRDRIEGFLHAEPSDL